MSRRHPRIFPVIALGPALILLGCEEEAGNADATLGAGGTGGSGGAPSGGSAGSTHFEVIPGCENAGDIGRIEVPNDPTPTGGTATSYEDERALFDARVAPQLGLCRTCHVAGGVGDTDEGRRFMLTSDESADYDQLKSSWVVLGEGVETSPVLTFASGEAEHSGGAPWTQDGAAYEDIALLLGCFADPDGCPSLLAGRAPSTGADPVTHPLLGATLEDRGGRNYAAVYCEDKPDCATLPEDPRELIAGENIDNHQYAVYFNDPFEVCINDTLLETQARQNAILVERGERPAYTAKPRPTNCGEWRTAVDRGREYITHDSDSLTGAVLTVESIVNIAVYLDYPIVTTVEEMNAALEAISLQRYGWPKAPHRNPAPLPGEDPNATDGGSLQLPLSMVQVKDDAGLWTGQLAMTCFACHHGMIGTGEVLGNTGTWDDHPEYFGAFENGLFLGMNGSNTDIGISLYDMEMANGLQGENSFNAVLSNPTYMTNRTRGTNAADQEVINLTLVRNWDTLDFQPGMAPSEGGKDFESWTSNGGGDQDVPTWWWTHNKTRYLWVGFGTSGSSRGNYFPGQTNPFDGHWSKRREGDYQDMDIWLNTVEAPPYVGPAPDEALAAQGAVLFHSKDLWADLANADIPRPPGGNGSCANCHGAYSPQFIHQEGYLPDARLGGYTGYTVPMNIIQTDPAQSSFFQFFGPASGRSTEGGANEFWMSYPDAQPGYRIPEERAAGETPFPAGTVTPGRTCGLGALGGYTAQPLHGVWASGPYFHNGSVPTVWDVLSPETRPAIWRRQRVPESEASPIGDRGYDTRLDRAYDHEKLGWSYDVFECDPSPGAPYSLSCATNVDVTLPPSSDPTGERTIYNTNGYSKSNVGHAFTKVLTDDERRALVEYLKTL